MPAKSTRGKMTFVRQICELIPSHTVPKLAREFEIDARKLSAWSHTTAHIYGQLTHAVGLNDICDGLDLNSSELRAIRGATPPKRNTFSNANRTRDPRMAEALYWQMVEYLPTVVPSFGARRIRSGYLRRFNAAIHAVDSTTIQRVANCMDWAKHRRRKAAAKCHMNLNLHTMLPRYAVVDTAKFHDSKKAWEVCAVLQDGEIVVFDKAYLDFEHLNDLDERGVSWVSRAKDNMQYRTVKKLDSTSHRSRSARRDYRAYGRAHQAALPQAAATGRGDHRGGRQRCGDDVCHQQPGVECLDRGRIVPGTVGDRGVLQGDQADRAVGGFRRP